MVKCFPIVIGCLCALVFAADPTKLPTAGENMTAQLIKENDKVVIKNVHGWFVGDKESSPHAQQEVVMQATGDSRDYDYYVGVSGLAFRMQISKDGFCPSSPHPNCGYKCNRAEQLYPWTMETYSCKPDETEKVKEIRKRIVESINRGIPVPYGSEEAGVIVGYQKNGEELIAYHPMHDGGKTQFIEKNWPWGFDVFGNAKKSVPAEKQLFIESIKQAIEMFGAKESGTYYVGFNAWDNMIKKLEDLNSADDKARQAAIMGNSWIYECLASHRRSAAKYLRRIAPEFPKEPQTHLLNAAQAYSEIAEKILTGKECVLTIAPPPWFLKDGQVWSNDMRKEEIRRLKMAFGLEKKAVDELKLAVKGI